VRRSVRARVGILALHAGRPEAAGAGPAEGWGSIAAALLEAGTSIVIATDRSVRDDVALAMIRDFYAQSDRRTDPAYALASVQRSLDARAAGSSDEVTRARSWAAFSVLGRPPEVRAHSAGR
jgi:CHAT domain-containing protein